MELPFLQVRRQDGRLERPGDRVRRRARRPWSWSGAGRSASSSARSGRASAADVTVVEFLPKIVAGYDDDVVRQFSRLLQKQGLKIETGAKVTGLRPTAGGRPRGRARGEGARVPGGQDPRRGRPPALHGRPRPGDGGRRARREEAGQGGRPPAHGVPGIWAIGDVVAGPMLAHKAEEDGVAVAEWIAGKGGPRRLGPRARRRLHGPRGRLRGAWRGRREGAASIPVNVGKFNFAANGRAIANDATDGFAKIVADAQDRPDPRAPRSSAGAPGELIAEVVAHMVYGGSAEDLGRTIHAHPTLSEAAQGGRAGGLEVGNPCYLTRAPGTEYLTMLPPGFKKGPTPCRKPSQPTGRSGGPTRSARAPSRRPAPAARPPSANDPSRTRRGPGAPRGQRRPAGRQA